MNLMVSKMNKLAVITYYNGNYKQIAKLCENLDFKVFFYNKRNNDFGLKVKNIGIDVYDKFHFIVNNYHNLPEIVLFLLVSVPQPLFLTKVQRTRTVYKVCSNLPLNL